MAEEVNVFIYIMIVHRISIKLNKLSYSIEITCREKIYSILCETSI